MNHLPRLSLGIQRSVGDGLGVQRFAVAPAISLPVYGNYCGPGYGDESGCTRPIDAVDAVCCRHDQCYRRQGYFNCGCNWDLVEAMPAAIANTPSAEGKAAGAAIMAVFANALCWP